MELFQFPSVFVEIAATVVVVVIAAADIYWALIMY